MSHCGGFGAAQSLFDYEAVLFDLDGVLTPTSLLHRRAWKEAMNRHLRGRLVEPFADEDYYRTVDGRPRAAGIEAFFASRGLTVSGDEVREIGDAKNALFGEMLASDGIAPYPGSLALLNALADSEVKLAVVSSSKNAEAVLAAAGINDRFGCVIDGLVAAVHGLPGKPAPDTFWYAATHLGVAYSAAVVVEDAVAGVRAGAGGGFGLVVGVDRGTGAEPLTAAGADVVVSDLGELLVVA
ncbi:MAG: HAD-IA family hydrolase [Nocardioides sp.]